jgi:hypothetical protein
MGAKRKLPHPKTAIRRAPIGNLGLSALFAPIFARNGKNCAQECRKMQNGARAALFRSLKRAERSPKPPRMAGKGAKRMPKQRPCAASGKNWGKGQMICQFRQNRKKWAFSPALWRSRRLYESI